jgi:RNA polymerase sigma-70 factor (ECF subfamily)
VNTSKKDQFLSLYEPVYSSFERFCRARTYGDMDYEDLMNETLLLAFQKFDQLQSKDSFLSFLFGISVRLLANNHRKKKAELHSGTGLENVAIASENTEQRAEVHLLHKALRCLKEEQREALILFEISGFPIKEIAQIQECSVDAVKQRLSRGRKRLTEILTFESEYKLGKEGL